MISMAGAASDVLAVQLLLKESGVLRPMRVVPLFETLADLDNAGPVIEKNSCCCRAIARACKGRRK